MEYRFFLKRHGSSRGTVWEEVRNQKEVAGEIGGSNVGVNMIKVCYMHI
jgi:hypothetical protein